MIFASTLLAALLMLTSAVAPTAATDGHYSVNLRLTALTPESVRTTVILNGVEKSATVSAHTTDFTLDYTMSSDQVLDNKPILLEVSVLAGANFETKTLELDRASPRVHSVNELVRIVAGKSECAKNYYGPFCSLYCAANEALHWTCSSEGVLGCAEGWQGPKCAERACPVACVHGHCDGAVCRCRPGFAGPACDQCIPAAGCLSGACRNNTPDTCGGCAQGWAGPLCNIDLSLCSAKKSPCAVGSTCIVKAPGKTACICPEGKTGANCDVDAAVTRPCPCKNGGRCSPLSIRTPAPVCQCPLGYSGAHCETAVATTVTQGGGENNHSAIATHNNVLVVMNVFLCLVVLLIGTVLIVLALRFIRSSASGACGRPTRSEEPMRKDENRKDEEKPQQKLSTVSLLVPDNLQTLPPPYESLTVKGSCLSP